MTKICITGGSGFLGSLLSLELENLGHNVTMLRRPNDWPGLTSSHGSFNFHNCEALIHCAWDFTPGNELTCAMATRSLFSAASSHKIKIINISSMSATTGNPSVYGKNKRQTEIDGREFNATSFRCGLLWHPLRQGSIVKKMIEHLRSNKVLPIIGTGQYPQFTTNIVFLALNIHKALNSPSEFPQSVYSIVSKIPMPFIDLVSLLCSVTHSNPFRIHIPWRPLYFAALTAERLGIDCPFRADSILSLVHSSSSADNPIYHQPVTLADFNDNH